MTTRAPAAIAAIYVPLQQKWGKRSVKVGGIVGDLAHRQRGGFHISRQDQPSTNYSVRHAFNRQGPGDWAAAIDITLTDTLMRLFSARLRAAVNAKDPRIVGCAFEWFGTLNSNTVTGDLLYDTASRRKGRTSSDSTHLWHVHISFRRDRITKARMLAVADVLMGVPLPKPTPKPTPPKPNLEQETDMPLTPADVKMILTSQVIPNPSPSPNNRLVSLQDLAIMTYRAAASGRTEGKTGDAADVTRDEALAGELSRLATAVEALQRGQA